MPIFKMGGEVFLRSIYSDKCNKLACVTKEKMKTLSFETKTNEITNASIKTPKPLHFFRREADMAEVSEEKRENFIKFCAMNKKNYVCFYDGIYA